MGLGKLYGKVREIDISHRRKGPNLRIGRAGSEVWTKVCEICRMRFLFLLSLAVLASPLAALAGRPPQLFMDVARFRNLNLVEKGAEVEIYVTVPMNALVFKQRAPRTFQSAAIVTLDILKADGKAIYHDVITLKPPVQNDTTMALKNGLSFLRRVMVPDGRYTLRGTVRDLYRTDGVSTTLEQPLLLAGPATPFLSDVLLLAYIPRKSFDDSNFNRGGYLLTRAPGGAYGRGAETLYYYAELHNVPAGQPVRVHAQIVGLKESGGDQTRTGESGRPTSVMGALPLGELPEGPFTVLVDVFSGTKLLTSQRVAGHRYIEDFGPAGAPPAPSR